MEFDWRNLRELRELLRTRRYRRLVLALLSPMLLVVFLIYAPERYDAYLSGATFVMGGVHIVLRGEVLVGWAGQDEVVEGCFATGIGISTFCIGTVILVYAL